MTSAALNPSSHTDWPRLLLGALIGVVLGLLLLGVVLAAWWLGLARHDLQRLTPPEGLEARLEQAAGPAAFGLTPVYVYDPDGAGRDWLAQTAPLWEAQGHEVRAIPVGDDEALEHDLARLAQRWAEPPRRPLILWREGEDLILCRCDSPRARTQARQALEASSPDAESVLSAPAAPPSARRPRLPPAPKYPTLGPPPKAEASEPPPPAAAAPTPRATPAPRLPGDPAPSSSAPAARPTSPASAPAPRRERQPRRADPPEARRDADSLFF